MCGRFTISVTIDELEQFLKDDYDINYLPNDLILPRYNVAPGQDIISIINDGNKNRIGTLNWGFVPSFSKTDKVGFNMINARSETLASKPSFKDSFINKRCVILADGFYEWKRENKEKIPMRFKLKSNELFTFAGLWSCYIKEDDTKHYTCTIITTTSNELIRPIHERMPVILTKENERLWLNPSIKEIPLLNDLLKPYSSFEMEAYQVSKIVNNSRNESSQCIEPV